MIVSFKAAQVDTSPAATNTNLIRIPTPTGVVDGDLLIACISVNGGTAGIITPPDGWTLIRRIDAGTATSLAVYYRIAEGEVSSGSSWNFSTSAKHSGTVSAYTNVDRFAVVDAFVSKSEPATVTPSTADCATFAVGAMTLAVFGSSVATESFGAPTGYVRRAQQAKANATVAVFDRVVSTPGTIASASASAAGTAGGAYVSLVLVLRPSIALTTAEQARQFLKANFPPGADQIYDWDDSEAEVYKMIRASSEFEKKFGHDYVDLLSREVRPTKCVVDLPDWESVLGLTTSETSEQSRWTSTRQTKVLAKLRESGSFTFDNIRAAIEPLLGYQGADIGTLEIIETDRAALTAAHTYPDQYGVMIDATTRTFIVLDDGVISASGIRLAITSDGGIDFSGVSFTLQNEDGTVNISASVGAFGPGVSPAARLFYDVPNTSGQTVKGTWTLVLSGTGGNDFTTALFVEGIGRDSVGGDGLGAAAFEWGVYADPAKVNSPDYAAVLESLERLTPAFAVPHLIRSLSPYPDETSGVHAAIPDQCIPV